MVLRAVAICSIRYQPLHDNSLQHYMSFVSTFTRKFFGLSQLTGSDVVSTAVLIYTVVSLHAMISHVSTFTH